MMDLKNLGALIDLLREKGVMRLRMDSLELELGPEPAQMAKATEDMVEAAEKYFGQKAETPDNPYDDPDLYPDGEVRELAQDAQADRRDGAAMP